MNSKKLIITGAFMLLALGTRCFADSSEANLTTLVPNQSIYVPRVPTPSELTKVATAQGSTIGQIVQTADSITVQYIMPGGQTSTVAYHNLDSIESGPVPQTVIATPSTPAPTYVTAPVARTVIYTESPEVYYSRPYYYGDPYAYGPWFAPVGLSIGFGWHGGGHGGEHGRRR